MGFVNHYSAIKDRFDLHGLVQVHHIYPRQFRNHPLLRNYDINDKKNLVLMPTKKGEQLLNIRDDRLIHDGGHASYNRYIGKTLHSVSSMPSAYHSILLNNTQRVLRSEMRRHTFVPWY